MLKIAKLLYIGVRILDAGDIIQTLAGWTVIGYGKSQLPLIRFPFEVTRNFRKKSTEIHRGLQAMDEAISELSLKCSPMDTSRALYLLSAPAREMNIELMKDLGDYLRGIAPEAIIRNGDYPREKGILDVTVILSELSDVEKVRNYYTESASFIPEVKKDKGEWRANLAGWTRQQRIYPRYYN